ncbi:hypothetical protein [Candidatus Chlorohelix allophototropha]
MVVTRPRAVFEYARDGIKTGRIGMRPYQNDAMIPTLRHRHDV